MNFHYYLPVNLIFGEGTSEQAGEECKKYGKKVLIVTGENSTKKTGLLDRIIGQIKKAEISYVLYNKVPQNPLTTTAIEGALLAKQENCDVVLGLGGGSAMDTAKAIAFLAVNNGDISDYIYGQLSSNSALPIILVPTTCGTGSEGNGFAVLTNPETKDKKSLRCNAIIAKSSIVDPLLMTTMPKDILATVGFDAFCHCMEAYLSFSSQPITDSLALNGMKYIALALPRVYKDYGDIESWAALSLGSTYGGMAINTAGVTLLHGMEHPVSGLYNVTHGKGLAALAPVVLEESIKGSPEKFMTISKILGGKNEADCTESLRRFLDGIGLTTTLAEQGVKEEDVEWMTDNCLKVSTAGIKNHPVLFDRDGIKELYKKALS